MPPVHKSAQERRRWPALLAVAFLAVAPVALFWPALFFHAMLYGFDTITLSVPFHVVIQRSLAAHEWPLWMPDVLGGLPGIASCNLQFMYPTDFVGCFSGLSIASLDGLDSTVHVALAGVGMFLFLRRMNRSVPASLLAAFMFAFSGSEVSQVFGGYFNLMEGVAWVPWAFWAAHKGRKQGSWFAWGLCGLAFAMQILAGATQLLVYTLPAVAFFVLSPAWNSGGKAPIRRTLRQDLAAHKAALQGLGLSLLVAFLLAAPQLWPTLQYVPLCARQGYTHAQFDAGSIGLSEAVGWLVPGFYGWHIPSYHGPLGNTCVTEYFGLLPWALAAAAGNALWRREAAVRWMAALALTAFFLAQRQWTPFYALFHALPVITGLRIWKRILFLLTFAVCTLAAYGWDALRTASSREAALRGAALFSALALGCAALAWAFAPALAAADAPRMGWFAVSPDGPRRTAEILSALARGSALTTLALVPLVLVLLWISSRRLGLGVALLLALALQVQDQKAVFTRFVQFMDPRKAFDQASFPLPPPGLEPWRVFDDVAGLPNRSIFHGYENLVGSESVPMQSSKRIMESLGKRRREWFDLMDVRYRFGPARRGSGNAAAITSNPGAFPRAWLVDRVRPVSGDEEAYSLLAEPRFNPRDEVALNAGSSLAPFSGAAAAPPRGRVLWLARGPQSCSLAVTTDRAAVLVLADDWYPSWKASVDGLDTPVLKADGGLQAVLLGAGRHEVDFSFDNGLFYDALAACLAGLIFLAGLAMMEKDWDKKRALRRPRP